MSPRRCKTKTGGLPCSEKSAKAVYRLPTSQHPALAVAVVVAAVAAPAVTVVAAAVATVVVVAVAAAVVAPVAAAVVVPPKARDTAVTCCHTVTAMTVWFFTAGAPLDPSLASD